MYVHPSAVGTALGHTHKSYCTASTTWQVLCSAERRNSRTISEQQTSMRCLQVAGEVCLLAWTSMQRMPASSS